MRRSSAPRARADNKSFEKVEMEKLMPPTANDDRKCNSPSSYTLQDAGGAPDDEAKIALLAALIKDDLEEVKKLVDRYPTMARKTFGIDRSPAILIASVNCSKETIDFLMTERATWACNDLKGRTPILVAAASGNASALSGLLEGNNAHYVFNTEDLVSAGSSAHPEKTEELEDALMSSVYFKLPLPAVKYRTPLHEAAYINNLECMESLLKNGAHVRFRDSVDDTALHLAIKGCYETKVTTEAIIDIQQKCIKLLVDNGADLSEGNGKMNKTETPLHLLLRNECMGVRFLQHYFDSQIKVKDEDLSNTAENNTTTNITRTIGRQGRNNIALNFSSLCPNHHRVNDQVSVILKLIEIHDSQMRRNIFSHPLIRAFLELKWSSIRIFFYIYVSMFILYVASLSVFVSLVDSEDFGLKTSNRVILFSKFVTIFMACLEFIYRMVMICVLVYSRLFLFGLSSHSKLGNSRLFKRVFYNIFGVVVAYLVIFISLKKNLGENTVTETTTVIASSSSPWNKTHDIHSILSTQETRDTANIRGGLAEDLEVHTPSYAEQTITEINMITAMAVFLAWVEMMLMISSIPKWAAQALVFIPVMKNVLRILMTYSCLIVGFAFCFFVLFRGSDPNGFGDPWRAFIKTFVMMTGEYDYNDIFGSQTSVKTSGPWSVDEIAPVSRIMFLVFIITASITLMNLMITVAVIDTPDLLKTANENRNTLVANIVIDWYFLINWLSMQKSVPSRIRRYLEKIISMEMHEMYNYTKIERFPFQLCNEIRAIAYKNAHSATSRPQERGKVYALLNAIIDLVDDQQGKIELSTLQTLFSS